MQHRQRLLLSPLLTLGIAGLAVIHGTSGARDVAAFAALAFPRTPTFVQAGIPFVVRDGYATQVCVSTRSGRLLPPFVGPADPLDAGVAPDRSATVQVGVPFVVHGDGTQICVSTRGGRSLPPFILP
jgi:hypothetical protein